VADFVKENEVSCAHPEIRGVREADLVLRIGHLREVVEGKAGSRPGRKKELTE
jgi:hypothetical protein